MLWHTKSHTVGWAISSLRRLGYFDIFASNNTIVLNLAHSFAQCVGTFLDERRLHCLPRAKSHESTLWRQVHALAGQNSSEQAIRFINRFVWRNLPLFL